ncbi:polysaccharide deacetylase family protein [Tenacibaculum crassostreae]|uniref:polysaccharide deacetylase family protein n=1 Tax=Tenacibaculum crassostreae TaxID=502683 RepID=UPI0038937F76
MRLYFIKTPRILKQLFAKYTWSFFTHKKEIYVTFDDGPIPEVTEFVLDQLKEYNAKATFFCIGDNVRKYPAIFSRIVSEGHTVGNHTFNHLNGWKTSNDTYFENTNKCEKLLNQKTKLFRPPYGRIKKSQAKHLLAKGYKIIMWDVLSADFDTNISKEKCLQNVVKNTKKGSIIVFHDSIKASDKLYYALPKVLKEFSEKGYEFKAIY